MSHARGIEICIVIIKAKANLSHLNVCQPRKNLYFSGQISLPPNGRHGKKPVK